MRIKGKDGKRMTNPASCFDDVFAAAVHLYTPLYKGSRQIAPLTPLARSGTHQNKTQIFTISKPTKNPKFRDPQWRSIGEWGLALLEKNLTESVGASDGASGFDQNRSPQTVPTSREYEASMSLHSSVLHGSSELHHTRRCSNSCRRLDGSTPSTPWTCPFALRLGAARNSLPPRLSIQPGRLRASHPASRERLRQVPINHVRKTTSSVVRNLPLPPRGALSNTPLHPLPPLNPAVTDPEQKPWSAVFQALPLLHGSFLIFAPCETPCEPSQNEPAPIKRPKSPLSPPPAPAYRIAIRRRVGGLATTHPARCAGYTSSPFSCTLHRLHIMLRTANRPPPTVRQGALKSPSAHRTILLPGKHAEQGITFRFNCLRSSPMQRMPQTHDTLISPVLNVPKRPFPRLLQSSDQPLAKDIRRLSASVLDS
ncbi:uncharacterized protein CLUP02_02731 [Colletotrichum lupini]|uniref:Uncharacterized protein n=1 Tax=Colletotrichum lupini TaxID=145971 RepID=A0A9Q8SH96_9PEZI|nr:uncharacterized protein CLUP02_02731 [Colletotrichum lupini]UQC77264.1 hypothetical protein CLUP02_02731 [Colletotrichum lupini]